MGDEDSFSGYRDTIPYDTGDYPPVAAALEFGKGRIIFIGHDGFIGNTDLDKYDNLRFGLNMIDWLCGDISVLQIVALQALP